uniref:Putative secreted peptide n=1 Tax=Anopheles braziliensis TaxID=58242 RepID=A0A2M3ZSM4_9DIPT
MWFLGAGMACVVVLHARHYAAAGALVGQSVVPSVRGPTLEGCCQDGDEAARRIALRSGAACVRHARHCRYDAGRYQAEQGPYHSAASVRGVALLEGKHPVEGARAADTDREHDSAVREDEGRLVDQYGTLQSRAYPAWCDRR